MSTDNPLLSDATLPPFSKIEPASVVPAIDAILADYQAGIDAITSSGAPRDFDSVMLEQERLDQRLSRAWAPVSHLHAVADSKE
ncbi:MAG TPA: oligopeptidase A, partial [Rhodanobacteraceae bacterium]